jgi:hypothetical protein
MPITDTLKNAEDFRRVGFTQEQSSVLAAKLEDTVHRQSEDLKVFIRQELILFRAELRGELREGLATIRVEMGSLRADFHSALRDQLVKIVAIVAALITAAVAIIKLVPPHVQ